MADVQPFDVFRGTVRSAGRSGPSPAAVQPCGMRLLHAPVTLTRLGLVYHQGHPSPWAADPVLGSVGILFAPVLTISIWFFNELFAHYKQGGEGYDEKDDSAAIVNCETGLRIADLDQDEG